MSNVIARAVYQDHRDSTAFDYRIEDRPGGYALIHGLAGRGDLQTEEFFQRESAMRSMLPQPHADTPSCNFAVETLLAEWRATMIRSIDLDGGDGDPGGPEKS